MIFSDCIIDKDNLYAFSKYCNCLIKYNTKDGKSLFLGMIPNQSETYGLVSKMFKYEDRLLLVPNNASAIYEFDLNNNSWKEIYINDATTKNKFATALIYYNKVVMLGATYKGIVIYNFENGEVSYFTKLYKFMSAKSSNDIFCRDYAKMDENSILIPSCNSNKIIKLNLFNMKFEVWDIGKPSDTFESIYYEHDYCYITSRNENKLSIIDIKKNQLREISLDASDICYGHYCGITKKDNKIILLALNEEKSCEYDLISNDIKYNNRRYYIYNKMNDVIIVEDKNHNITISTTEKEIKIDKAQYGSGMINFDVCMFYNEDTDYTLEKFSNVLNLNG